MKYKFIPLMLLAGLLVAGTAAAQDATNTVEGTDYASFQLIASRSIFNPSRTAPRRNTVRNNTPVARVDSFTLVGTMTYKKGQFAFFDGSSSAYRQTLNVGQSIGGYKIAGISPDAIILAASSNQTINLPVGTQMRRREGGRWSVAGIAEPTPDVAPAPDAAGAAAPADAAAAAALPANMSDAAKRLMLQRLNEK